MAEFWRVYHEATKHTPERLRRAAYALDWSNMPNPFRHYEGVPVLDLPADPEAPEISAWDVLRGRSGPSVGLDGAGLLSTLLFYSASISATKIAAGSGHRYALRVNASSGNLHPTEFHFATSGLAGWPDGLYHYRPSQHMAEQRGAGDFGFDGRIVFILTTIAWREAWKYRDRAYRYCLLDMGHAYQALLLAARAMGFRSQVTGSFDDAEVSSRLRLANDEWPLAIVTLGARAESGNAISDVTGGTPNVLSETVILPDLIEKIHAATCGPGPEWNVDDPVADITSVGGAKFGDVVRSRRSALDFVGGEQAITMAQMLALLSVAHAPSITLYLYVHRVQGLAPGLYRFREELELLREGDQRVAAAGLSLGQDLAGNACFAISMAAGLANGNRGYRYAHFEAGALGQRLYVAAEALGLRATGIGAFYDDRVHTYLGLQGDQVIYHFAIGYPVPDPRLEA